MPDFKFWDSETSRRLVKAVGYPKAAKAAIREMHRQVGDLTFDEMGLAQRGLLVRHLIMPGGLAGTRDVMRFMAHQISPDTYLNIMSQYRPEGKAHLYPEIDRSVTVSEYEEAISIAEEEGLHRFDERRKTLVNL